MIRFPFYNGTRAIEGFREDEAHHLMRESHLGEGNLLVGTLIDCLREAIGTTNDEDKSSGSSLLTLYPLGKFDAAEFLTMFVHQYNGI